MPFITIMIAANTVYRASPAFSAGAASMTETSSATSITVTATARTSVPKGSPVRCATNLGVVYGRKDGGDQGYSCARSNEPPDAYKEYRQQD